MAFTGHEREVRAVCAAGAVRPPDERDRVVVERGKVAQVDDDLGCIGDNGIGDGHPQAHRSVAVDLALSAELGNHPADGAGGSPTRTTGRRGVWRQQMHPRRPLSRM